MQARRSGVGQRVRLAEAVAARVRPQEGRVGAALGLAPERTAEQPLARVV
jgi:hypothetical protein